MKTNFSASQMQQLTCILAFCVSLSAVHGQTTSSSNSAPLIAITYPTNGARYVAPADLALFARINDPKERVDQVKFFANTNFIYVLGLAGEIRFPGYPVDVGNPWLFVPVGDYTLTAVACGPLGENLGTSAPVRISVEFSCEQGIVILPQVSGTGIRWPELGILIAADVDNELDFLQTLYFKSTEENREFRRGFAEFAIPPLPVAFSSAHLLLRGTPRPGDLHELSYYASDLVLTTNDYNRPASLWTTFEPTSGQEQQTFLIDVTSLVRQFEGTNLGFRLKLADDPTFDEIGDRGTGFDPPRLILNTCSNPPPRVSIFVRDLIASEGPWLRHVNPAEFVVRRSGPTDAALTVYYDVKGSAANGIDYKTLSGTVTIPAGERFAPIVVRPLDDSLVERTEFVVLNLKPTPTILDSNVRLSLPPPYFLGSHPQATALIIDNDYRRWFGK